MNIFFPYQAIEHTNKHLHLALPKWRRNIQFFLYRIFPFLLLGLMVPVLLNSKDIPMGMLYLLVLSVLVVCCLLFFKKFTVEVNISTSSIMVLQKGVGTTTEKTILISEIQEITCRIRHGKHGGTFFKVKLKTGENIELISIPVLNMKRENTDQIIAVIEQLTRIKITLNLPFYRR